MNKERIKLNTRKQTLKRKLDKGKSMGNSMAADADAQIQGFGNTLTNQSTSLRDIVVERKSLQSKVKALTIKINRLEESWLDTYRAAARRLMDKYPGKTGTWKRHGYALKDPEPTSKGRPAKVLNLRAVPGQKAGTIDLKWKAFPPGTIKGYILELNTEDIIDHKKWFNPKPPISSKAKTTITGLESGKKYWVQVSAFVTAHSGPPSNAVSLFAP